MRNQRKKYWVLGSGKTAEAVCRYLEKENISFYWVAQSNSQPSMQAWLSEFLSQEDILKSKDDFYFPQVGAIVSPGIPPHESIVKLLMTKGVDLYSDLDLDFLKKPKKFRIGVTGTNGKTTLCLMLEHLFKSLGVKAEASGNIGVSPLLSTVSEAGIDVLELSSYQLYYSSYLRLDAAAWTSFSDDHLEWHKSRENYFRSKEKIFTLTKNAGKVWVPKKLSNEYGFNTKYPQKLKHHEELDLKMYSDIYEKLYWPKHDIRNFNMALDIVLNVTQQKIENSDICLLIKSFKRPEHRFQFFLEDSQGVKWINDSKSTNLHSTLSALENMKEKLTLWIGGKAKDTDFHLLKNFENVVESIVLFGRDRQEIRKSFVDVFLPQNILMAETLSDALSEETLKNLPKNTNIQLFSPGCASFDEFSNYEERGHFFMNKVKTFTKSKDCPSKN